MGRTALIVVAAALPLLFVGVMLAVRRPLQSHHFRGTGWDEWRATARGLSWRDRVRLERANSRGRAVGPSLAPLAVARGQALTAVGQRTQQSPRMRWVNLGLAVIGSLLVVLNAGLIVTGGGSGSAWFQLVLWAVLTPLYALMPRLQRRTLRRVQRSVDLNRSVVERESDSGVSAER